jgi:uncharacterized protein (DUF433 family)
MVQNPLLERIVQVPDILGGKPTIKGTRISVEHILANLRDNPSYEDLLRGYPRLPLEDVRACFAYAEVKVRRTRRVKRTEATPPVKSAVA